MNQVEKLDKNMAAATLQNEDEYVFYPAHEAPIRVYGIQKEADGYYRRLPKTVADAVSEGVSGMNDTTAGGRFVFRTNADRLAIKVSMPQGIVVNINQNFMNSCGMDVYARENGKQRIVSFLKPGMDVDPNGWAVETKLHNPEHKELELILYAGTYSYLKDASIGIPRDCYLKEADPYTYETPIVFYGSSITHGACADRPALVYASLVSQELDSNFINLGFGGNAKGEDEIAEYIANLSMSAFVYDYDHNAPTAEHLRNTHERMYRIVREKHPDIPIIMLSRPHYHAFDAADLQERFEIISATYENAKARGEKVYLLDGRHLYDEFGYSNCAQDNAHPNTLGMYAMYRKVCPILKEALGIS